MASDARSLESICSLIVDCPHSTPAWTDSGGVVLRNQNIRNGRLDLSDPSFTDAEHFAGRNRRAKPTVGDIVITREAPMGEVCMIPEGLECCLGQRQVLLRPIPKLVNPKFLLYALQSSAVKHQIGWNEGTGSTVSNIRIPVLKALSIPTPSRETQDDVAAILGAIDDRIDNLRKTNASLEAIAQALFKSWFVDCDPVHAKAEGREPEGMDAATAALFPSEFEDSGLGPIPQGWRIELLADAFEINSKRTLKKGSLAKYLDMASVPTTGHVPDAPVDRIFASGSKFTNGDTLLARITPCLENGKTAHVDFLADDETAWGSTEFIVLRPRAPLPSYFGYLLARQKTFRTFAIQAMSGTSGRQRVEIGRLEQFRLPVPDVAVAIRFGEIIEPVRRAISANAKQAETFGSLRDTLLPRLISGKLRLSDAESMVADMMESACTKESEGAVQ